MAIMAMIMVEMMMMMMMQLVRDSSSSNKLYNHAIQCLPEETINISFDN